MADPIITPDPLLVSDEPLHNVVAAREKPQLYLDCDGVLADFDSRAEEILGSTPRVYEDTHGSESFWDRLYQAQNFFRDMQPLASGRNLFEIVKHLNPIILTGCPRHTNEDGTQVDEPADWAVQQKTDWAAQHFPGTTLIAVRSRDKRVHCRVGDVLVDDTLTYRKLWEQAGGIFVHHTSLTTTVAELIRLGLLEERTIL